MFTAVSGSPSAVDDYTQTLMLTGNHFLRKTVLMDEFLYCMHDICSDA